MRGHVIAQLRQIEQDRHWRTEDRGAGEGGIARSAGRQIIGRAVLPDQFERAGLGIGSGADAILHAASVVNKAQRVARIEGQAGGWQPETCGVTPDPGLDQRPAALALGRLGGGGEGEGLRGNAGGVDGDAARLDLRRIIVAIGPGHLPFEAKGKLGLLRPRQFKRLAVGRLGVDQILRRDLGLRRAAAHHEAQAAFGLHAVKTEIPTQQGKRCTRRLESGDGVALDLPMQARHVDAVGREPGPGAEVAHESRK